MVARAELLKLLNSTLQPELFKDYCPNGLQVEGTDEIQLILGGVTASQALIDQAIARKAQAILVHHGYFWKSEPPQVTGIKQRRLKALLTHGINLIAYHLPLDAHPSLGNNVQLGKRLGLLDIQPLKNSNLVYQGRLPQAISMGTFGELVGQQLGRVPLLIGDTNKPVSKIAWCTGGAQGYFQEAIDAGVDVYLTGEASEPCLHLSQESGVAFIAAGHHATERDGIQALGLWLTTQLDVNFEFVDLTNPI